jgi:hypothetical protein
MPLCSVRQHGTLTVWRNAPQKVQLVEVGVRIGQGRVRLGGIECLVERDESIGGVGVEVGETARCERVRLEGLTPLQGDLEVPRSVGRAAQLCSGLEIRPTQLMGQRRTDMAAQPRAMSTRSRLSASTEDG